MGVFKESMDLYDRNQQHAGVYEKGRFGGEFSLLPLYHTSLIAQITVRIDKDGNFISAETVDKEEGYTVVPATEKSACRTNTSAPHPLVDNLPRIAGDYLKYITASSIEEEHSDYIELLGAWASSEHSHPIVKAVYRYVEKGTVVADLIKEGLLKTGKDGKLDKSVKIGETEQKKFFVRFSVQGLGDCWKDRDLQEAYIAFARDMYKPNGVSDITGREAYISYLHPHKLQNDGSKAKLFSANDKDGYIFMGLFRSKQEAMSIGYEESMKIHNALRWVIRRHGRFFEKTCFVGWESEMTAIPDPTVGTYKLSTDYLKLLPKESDERKVFVSLGFDTPEKLEYMINEYGKSIGESSHVTIVAFEETSNGRLSITEEKIMDTRRYLENIRKWHVDGGWLFKRFVPVLDPEEDPPKKKKDKKNTEYMVVDCFGVLGIKEMAQVLYGTEDKNNNFALSSSNEFRVKELLYRLLPCILEGDPVPSDIITRAVRNAANPMNFKKMYNWEKTMALACSLMKNAALRGQANAFSTNMEYGKEAWNMGLNVKCNDRSYLYGRLLAVADRMEFRTFDDNDEHRVTNARRFMQNFSMDPSRTWKIIEEKARVYLRKLSISERLYYEHTIEEICDLFQEGDFTMRKQLEPQYLLGYHNQASELRRYKGGNKDQDMAPCPAVES